MPELAIHFDRAGNTQRLVRRAQGAVVLFRKGAFLLRTGLAHDCRAWALFLVLFIRFHMNEHALHMRMSSSNCALDSTTEHVCIM